ncbi:hypothetical protein C5167_006923 [Papaver somniferum]|uniref:J domain-containing protein n=1 Tax=Papaver somniferum TaxID=3469 RepID=A0A4Y7JHV5_PAPSO|nr:uncharacterized protein LOC113274351 [Papaver somniferum]RZC59620.1 hypothetical protein C5167_006923 [Papaver somniferum]
MDHHKVLGLERNASKTEIREAFKKLALQYHPDKHSNSSQTVIDEFTDKFREICEAYEFLITDKAIFDSSGSRNEDDSGETSVRREPKYRASGTFGDGVWNYEGDVDPKSIKNFFYGVAFAGVLIVGSVVLKVAKRVLV